MVRISNEELIIIMSDRSDLFYTYSYMCYVRAMNFQDMSDKTSGMATIITPSIWRYVMSGKQCKEVFLKKLCQLNLTSRKTFYSHQN